MTKLISLEAENFMKLKAVRLEIKERGLTIISERFETEDHKPRKERTR